MSGTNQRACHTLEHARTARNLKLDAMTEMPGTVSDR
jgi:hypothetical protein